MSGAVILLLVAYAYLGGHEASVARATAAAVIVLGAGPAGLAAANGLARRGLSVHLVEAQAAVGGNAGSFELAGLRVDFGSHRLHPASHPAVFAELRELLGEDYDDFLEEIELVRGASHEFDLDAFLATPWGGRRTRALLHELGHPQ